MPLSFRSQKHDHRTPSASGAATAVAASLAVLGLLSLGLPASASSIAVSGAAARPASGTGCGGAGCGARVTLSGCMNTVDLTVPDQQLMGSQGFEACNSLSANAVEVTTGATVTFQAGQQITLGNGFSVGSGATFTAGTDPNLVGDASVEDRSPTDETRYVARFYANLDSMSLPGSDQFDHFFGSNDAGQVQFRVVLRHNTAPDENRLFVEAREDSGSFVSTEGVNEMMIPSGWHAIEVDWTAASTAGANDGAVVVCVDDDGSRLSCEQLGSLDNDLGQVDFVRWGAQGVDATTTGSLDMDDFDSRRLGPIGL